MSKATHDPLVFRLCQMLVKLNQGEELDAKSLAEEFNISIRTAQRDLSERFGYLPLEKNGTRYRLDPACLGKIGLKDIERFASLAGVRGLFPSLSDKFLRDIFDSRIQSALLIKGQHYESLAGREELFHRLEQAIVKRQCVNFVFCKMESRKKQYQNVEPYKMVNHRGVWYLAARDAGQLKTFGFSHIEQIQVLEHRFEFDPAIEKALIEEDGIWLAKDKIKVLIQVDKEVAMHFKRRKLINNQVIEQELAGGGLIISAMIGHTKQVLPIVRYWIPHLRIISPEEMRSELELGLAAYLDR